MVGMLAKLYRQGRSIVKEGKYGMPPTGKWLETVTHHSRWRGATVGGKPAVTGNITIGGELGDLSQDATKYIQKIDPGNTSGSIKDALQILEKLHSATLTDSLMTSIQPLQNILGSQLYSSAKKTGAQMKAKSKQQQEEVPAIISALIDAALELLSPEDAALVAELMDSNEMDNITKAFNTGRPYTSTAMPQSFVDAINSLIPSFQAMQAAGVA
jgi:hypothetical protein